jgi:hypothetical protein
VSDLAAGVSRKEIERVFTKHGTVNEVRPSTIVSCRSMHHVVSTDRCGWRLIRRVSLSSISNIGPMLRNPFEKSMESKSHGIGQQQHVELCSRVVGSTRVGVSWARTRTFGGRNRGSRGAPYGSYVTSGSRRRSR